MRYTKSLYFAFKEVGTTIEYKIIVNIKEKATIQDLIQQGYKVTKVFGKQ